MKGIFSLSFAYVTSVEDFSGMSLDIYMFGQELVFLDNIFIFISLPRFLSAVKNLGLTSMLYEEFFRETEKK